MNLLRIYTHSAVVLCAAVFLLTFGFSSSVAAQAPKSSVNVPILIVADDEDPNSASRSSAIVRRAITTLQSELNKMGYRVFGEEAIVGDLGWEIRARRPKIEIFQIPKLMSESGKNERKVRAIVLYRTFAKILYWQGPTVVEVRNEIEIYDMLANGIIDSFNTPRRVSPTPVKCNKSCVMEVVGDLTHEVARRLGVILAKKLSHYFGDLKGGIGTGTNIRGTLAGEARRRGSGSVHTMRTYNVTLRQFDRPDALTIIGVMADEFPGYKTHTLIKELPSVRKYSYVTSAKPYQMKEWLTILLKDMSFNPDKEVVISIKGNKITIERKW